MAPVPGLLPACLALRSNSASFAAALSLASAYEFLTDPETHSHVSRYVGSAFSPLGASGTMGGGGMLTRRLKAGLERRNACVRVNTFVVVQ